MKKRSVALVVVAAAVFGSFLFFVPIIPVWLPAIPPGSSCNSILCSSVSPPAVQGYGSVSYVWFGVGGTFYSPNHFRVLGMST